MNENFQSQNPDLQNLVEILNFVFESKDMITSLKEGNASDIKMRRVLDLLASLADAVQGYDKVLSGWKNAPQEQRTEVLEYFKLRFDLPNAELEAKLEKIIDGLVLIVEALFGIVEK